MIIVVTPTRNRPLTMGLLARWLRQQTVRPDAWIVVNDGEQDVKMEPPMTALIKRKPLASDPPITLARNLLTAIPAVFEIAQNEDDLVLICEDDEYYAPGYIAAMSARICRAQAVGIGHSKYYHLALRRWYAHDNMGHASLAQTGFRSRVLWDFLRVVEDEHERFIDAAFWRVMHSTGIIFRDGGRWPDALYVGMKGMPGQAGIGFGHKAMPQYMADDDLSILRRWIRPDDVSEYEKIGRAMLWMNSES